METVTRMRSRVGFISASWRKLSATRYAVSILPGGLAAVPVRVAKENGIVTGDLGATARVS